MFIRRAVAAVVLVLMGLGLGGAVPASAQPIPASHQFTPNDPSWVRENNVARFTGQVAYASMTFAWSLRLSPSVQAIVLGPMTCWTTISGVSGYSDNHADIPADYLLHSSVKIQRGVNCSLRSRCDFKVMTDTGPTPSNVVTAIDFNA
ncbi:hypothetical protein [Nocardia nova]|uniref:hypothetical protein n=1 Tax=Nocardia nova TaxID=37330 RepID=UPI0011B0900C|nr:hypothetical protein [Nocardia nova]